MISATAGNTLSHMKNLKCPGLALTLLLCSSHLLGQTVKCSQEAINNSAELVSDARKTLLQLPIGEGMETNVDKQVQHAVMYMKDALGAFISAYMLCSPASEKPDAKKIQADLSRIVHAFSLERGRVYKDEEFPDIYKYGFELSFEVRTTKDSRNLVGITATFSIECGSDTMLQIYEPQDGYWRKVLRWESVPYSTVAGAYEAFDYAISPPDSDGRWYVLTKNIMPWCSSTWSGIRYSVLRPRGGEMAPRVLFSTEDSIYWGNDDLGSLLANQNDFEVRFHSASIDTSIHNRVYIKHFLIDGDRITRVQPVAISPRDFVDEWIRSPWTVASQWSQGSATSQLKSMHAILKQLHRRGGFTFDSAVQCAGSADRYEIALSSDGKNEEEFYFNISEHDNFIMNEVSGHASSQCGGPNILETMESK